MAGFEAAGSQFVSDMRRAGVTVTTSDAVTLTRLPLTLTLTSPKTAAAAAATALASHSEATALYSDQLDVRIICMYVCACECMHYPLHCMVQESIWSVNPGEVETAEARQLQSEVGGLLREAAARAERHLLAAQSRIRQQAGLVVQRLQATKAREEQAMQVFFGALQRPDLT